MPCLTVETAQCPPAVVKAGTLGGHFPSSPKDTGMAPRGPIAPQSPCSKRQGSGGQRWGLTFRRGSLPAPLSRREDHPPASITSIMLWLKGRDRADVGGSPAVPCNSQALGGSSASLSVGHARPPEHQTGDQRTEQQGRFQHSRWDTAGV